MHSTASETARSRLVEFCALTRHDFVRMKKYLSRELVPVVIDRWQLMQLPKFAPKRLSFGFDFIKPTDIGGVAVGPTHFTPFANLIAPDVLHVFERRASFFSRFTHRRLEGIFKRLDSPAGNAPTSVGDVAN